MKILAMSGLVPEYICDTVRFTGYTGNMNIPHYCGYAADYISMVLQEKSIDGALFPRSCDSSRIIKSYLLDSGKFLYQMAVPARRDNAAVEYLAECLVGYKKALEKYFHISITDIAERAEAINIRNRRLRNLYSSLEDISYGEYLRCVHRMLKKPLAEQNTEIIPGKKTACGKKVFVMGSFLADERIADKMEECDLAVVGDDLPESGRLCSVQDVDLNSSEDLLHRIAAVMLQSRLSPSQNDFRSILKKDLAEIKEKNAQGVLYVTQKYCEPYDYLFRLYKEMLDQNGIPVLRLMITNSDDVRKTNLAIEAFADMIQKR